jgi:hypothetical protein
MPEALRAMGWTTTRRTGSRWSMSTTARPSAPASRVTSADLRKAGITCATSRPTQSSLEDIFVGLVPRTRHELPRHQIHLFVRDGADLPHHLSQSVISPVLSTSLYFIVFGAAIGSRIDGGRGRQLRRLHRAGADHADGADAERSPTPPSGSTSRKFLGTIYELLSAPVSFVEIVIGYVGAAATKR